MKRTANELAEIIASRLNDNNVQEIGRSLWFDLQKQKKISRLDEIIELVRRKVADKNNQIIVKILSAVELSSEEKNTLENKLTTKLGSKIHTRYFLDESLLGGVKIKINDEILDLSWRGKLEKLKEKTGR